MGKPVDRTDSIAQQHFEVLDDYVMENRDRRERKRVWKRARTKHLRHRAKEDLRSQEKQFFEDREEDKFWDDLSAELA